MTCRLYLFHFKIIYLVLTSTYFNSIIYLILTSIYIYEIIIYTYCVTSITITALYKFPTSDAIKQTVVPSRHENNVHIYFIKNV